MSNFNWCLFCILLGSLSLKAQHTLTIDAALETETNTLQIQQFIQYKNTSNDTLREIYLTDWANSFSSKTTPLAVRFAENFDSSFHFEKDKDRGRTLIHKISTKEGRQLLWERGKELDLIRVPLIHQLAPNDSQEIYLNYTIKLPDDKFTRFGVSKFKDYKLRYWFIAPGVYNQGWQVYSNKNTDDFYMPPSNFEINLQFPKEYQLISDIEVSNELIDGDDKRVHLSGKDRIAANIYLDKNLGFRSVVTDKLEVITDMKDKKVTPAIKALQVDRITRFLEQKLGPYPFKKLVISDADYRNSPVYGLNQLPDFISPFPSGFEMDMELLKTITRKYIEHTLPINPRKDYWLHGALQIYLMQDYVNLYYPDQKILGHMSEFFIIRWSHASNLEFNDQYNLLYMNVARNNLHQSLATSKDSLLKFNKNIANDYYAGTGFYYLSDYLGKEVLDQTITQFYSKQLLKTTTPQQFQEALRQNTSLPIDWFFEDYVHKRTTIDFKISKVESVGDSLRVTVKNKRNINLPVSLYGLNQNNIVFKKWLDPIDSIGTTMVPREGIRKLALNYENVVPEFNQRNNFKKTEGLLNRPLQLRLFQDIEDARYNQIFFMPVFSYNLYDGFSLGPKIYNKTFLPKGFHYRLEPQYAFRSKTIVGSGSLNYTDQREDTDLYYVRYGVSGNYFSYNDDLFYKRFSPFVTFAFRDHDDLRKNKRHFANFRTVSVTRDQDPETIAEEPNYTVYNAQYVYSDNNLINYYRTQFDFQYSANFNKLSTQFEYRKLFLNNRQLNLRFFAGMFLRNDTPSDDDFFSFALDRPTDYLFDYNYYGRSEASGLFSQQLIIAEGGFKSQLEPGFSNDWIMTINSSTNIWKWIYAYADIGLVKNKGFNAEPVYDTGIRASLVTDYFELYFPLYSNLGWEPGQDRYDTKVRFIVTLDIKTLLGLFTRKWY